MINGIFKKVNLENVSTPEVKYREFLHADKQKTEAVEKKGSINKDRDKDKNIDVKEALDRIVSVAKFFNRKIRLEVEEELDITVVKVVDSETDKVVRQIPPEEFLELSKKARDLKGLLINKEG